MATEEVKIKVTADTRDAKNDLKALGESLENLGGKFSQVGGFLTGAFTAPIVGAFAAAVTQSKELQAALLPVQQAFQQVAIEFGAALLPLVQELLPLMLDLARALSDMVKWFADLDPLTQKIVVGFALFIAALGPALMLMGQLLQATGSLLSIMSTLGVTLPSIGAAFTTFGTTAMAALAPLMPLIAAVAGLIALINSEFGQRGITAIKQLISIGAAEIGGLTGGRQGAIDAFQRSNEFLGLNQPAPAAGGFGGQTIIYNNNGIDMNNPIVKQALQPYINQQLRTNGMR